MITVFRSDNGELYETSRTKIVKSVLEESNIGGNKDLNIFQVRICKVIDHKGTLMIYWYDLPTNEEEVFFKNLWSLFNEDHIIHYLINRIEL